MKNIIGIYAGSPATEQQLADMTPPIVKGTQEFTEDRVTKERIRQLFTRGVIYLYENSSASLQARFPKENLVFGKRSMTLESKIKHSRTVGGPSYKIKETLEQGASLQDLQDAAGGRDNLRRASVTLQGWGIDIPDLPKNLKFSSLENSLQAENDDQKLQELFTKITVAFYTAHIKGVNPLLISIQGLLKEAGYHTGWRKSAFSLFTEVLKRSSIPIGRVRQEIKSGPQKSEQIFIHFILTKHKQRAFEELQAEPGIKAFLRNPVEQICGPQADIPAIWDIVKLKGFKACATIFYKATGLNYRSVLGYRGMFGDLLDQDCPVPIFRTRYRYYCRISQEEALIEYFRNKFLK